MSQWNPSLLQNPSTKSTKSRFHLRSSILKMLFREIIRRIDQIGFTLRFFWTVACLTIHPWVRWFSQRTKAEFRLGSFQRATFDDRQVENYPISIISPSVGVSNCGFSFGSSRAMPTRRPWAWLDIGNVTNPMGVASHKTLGLHSLVAHHPQIRGLVQNLDGKFKCQFQAEF